MTEDTTVIQRVLKSSALALESTMLRLRRLKEGDPPKAPPPRDEFRARPSTSNQVTPKRGAAPAEELSLADDPPPSRAASTREPKESSPAPARTGRVEHDSRGSAVWNWAIDTGTAALESTQRLLKRLESPALTLDDKPKRPEAERESSGGGGGYDPYNRGKPNRRR